MRDFPAARRAIAPVAAFAVLAMLAFAPGSPVGSFATGCPAGYSPFGAEEKLLYGRDVKPLDGSEQCVNDKNPESMEELGALWSQRFAIAAAPDGIVPAGAFSTALRERAAVLRGGQSPDNDNAWIPVGRGPLHTMEEGYSGVNGLGIGDVAGRITELAAITSGKLAGTVLASVGYGGVWISDASARKWTSIGDGLPTQVVGSVGYTPAGGGTIIALTGDGSFGYDSRTGAGAYYTTNLGKTWGRAAGVPDDAFGFKVAVDQSNPKIVYAATGAGLYRSTNGGTSYVNVALPTGECAGKPNTSAECILANMVTDVVVQAPGGSSDAAGGKVMAAVGWRSGNKVSTNGKVQSPNNGVYVSDTGAPGSFQKVGTGFAIQDRIGRIELGAAYGPEQNHDYVYAIVQDAVLLNAGVFGIDAPTGMVPPAKLPVPTYLEGIYVTSNFGQTWTRVADAAALQHPATGSALAGTAQALGVAPGIQSWYDMWIQPDPTRHAGGIPTRLLFGLEEVWQNEATRAPVAGPTPMKVVGRYYSGTSCLFLTLSFPVCPTDREDALVQNTTTHPDQHAVLLLPEADGGLTLLVGNDGGVYRQRLDAADGEFANTGWGMGANHGFNTLLPYDAVRSADGTIWMGLQDNGTAKIVDIRKNGRVVERERQIVAKGGDGFFVAVDPADGTIAYGETPGGALSATVDGGKSWTNMSPPITDAQFSNPFVMDPRNPKHLMIAGREVVETISGAGTAADDWTQVFDLGTHDHPGDADAPDTTDDVPTTDYPNQMSAIDLVGAAAYVGFCGPCDALNTRVGFASGLATNVGGSAPPKIRSKDGWHVAKAKGLPNRFITGIAIDPANPRRVLVSVGGYARRYLPPNTVDAEPNTRVGRGHLFLSTDAGQTFADVSGNLPNTPVNWVTLRGKQAIVATDVGVFVSDLAGPCAGPPSRACARYQLLGKGLPAAPVYTVRLSHGDPNLLVAAAYGRGAWTYRFRPTPAKATKKGTATAAPKFLGRTVAGPFGFEIGDEGWTATSTHPAAAWRRASPGNASGTSFQHTPYADESAASLISPAMTVPAPSTIKVSWWERRDTEPCCDFVSMEWSSDGKVWKQPLAVDGQNPDFPSFSNVSVTFVAPKGKLYVRFRITSDEYVSSPLYTGVAIDDVKVER